MPGIDTFVSPVRQFWLLPVAAIEDLRRRPSEGGVGRGGHD
mgnify:CR=1 FL=1